MSRKAFFHFIFILIVPLCLGGFSRALAQERAVSEKPALVPVLSDQEKRQQSFEVVWKTVNEHFYDPTFAGVDWNKVHERYLPRVAAATNDSEFHTMLQQMLNELHQSHFVVIPPNSIPKFIPPRKTGSSPQSTGGNDGGEQADTADSDDTDISFLLDRGNAQLTERLSTGIGIDVRVINRMVVITRVERNSSAERSGLRPGFVIKKVDSHSLEQAVALIKDNPVWNFILRAQIPAIILARYVNGPPNSIVRLIVLDGRNRQRLVSLRRERLSGEMSPAVGNLPPMYTEFESRLLAGGVGYIRFNAFVPPVMRKVCAAIRSMRGAPGLIIDLRGNEGGLLGMVNGLCGLLENEPISLGAMQTRTGQSPLYAFPQRAPFRGVVVIIIDGTTQSAAEMFASALQENGRAIVVGERSAGNALPSSIIKLPTGARFQYGWANFRTAAGKALEGDGVAPDITMSLSRRDLLLGRDMQLSTAMLNVRQQAKVNQTLQAQTLSKSVIEETPGEEGPETSNQSSATSNPAPPPLSVSVQAETNKPQDPAPPGLPSIDEIVEKYVKASGGEVALRKLTSRISKGTVEMPAMGLKGTVEVYEIAPNKSSTFVSFHGYGTVQRTFDGTVGWLLDPLQGYMRFAGPGVTRVSDESAFYKELGLKDARSGFHLVGKLKVGNRDAFVLQANSSAAAKQRLFFDAETGLLLRRDNVYYEDYREIDGVKLPFRVRDESFNGFAVVINIEEIKHNVTIDDSKFSEYPSCFTNPPD